MASTSAPGTILRTTRLRLRPWSEEDRAPFATMGADPAVMRHMPSLLDRAQSDALLGRVRDHFAAHGFGLWAVERLDHSAGEGPRAGEASEAPSFIGLVGLAVPSFEAAFTPCVEIAWRLASWAWGQGYATEAARAALGYGFSTLDLDQIVSFTVPANTASLRVMERLGMTRDPAEDFDHPRVPLGDRLSRHVLYRLDRTAWRAQNRV